MNFYFRKTPFESKRKRFRLIIREGGVTYPMSS